MSRNHIHFAPGMPKEEGVISGMRATCDIYIEIDMEAAIKDGIKFYISSNNVILTEGVDGVLSPKYFKRVVQKNGQLAWFCILLFSYIDNFLFYFKKRFRKDKYF